MVKSMIVALVLAASTAAHAEPLQLEDNDADPETAQRLSIIGSAIPLATIGVGTLVAMRGSNNAIRDFGGVVAIGGALAGIVTPALGELYSHHWINGTMVMRAGGLFVEFMGLVYASNSEIGDCADTTGPCHLRPMTIGLLGSGAALYLGATVWDVLAAPSEARAWNRRYSVQLVPTAMRTPSSTATGVMLSARF
jgi:hypothetical protein